MQLENTEVSVLTPVLENEVLLWSIMVDKASRGGARGNQKPKLSLRKVKCLHLALSENKKSVAGSLSILDP